MAIHQGSAFPFAFFKGNIVKTEDAKVSFMTNALQYGTGVFGGIRGYYNHEKGFISLFRIHDHYKLFLSSFKIIGVEIPYSQEQLIKITTDLVRKNNPKTDTYFRPFGYAGSPNLSPNLDRDHMFDFAMYMMPLGD